VTTASGTVETLLTAARTLAPLIRQHADEAERSRRLPEPVVTALAEAGLFRMLTPRALGGLEVPPLDFYRVVEEVASADGSAGWCLFIGGAGPVLGARLGDAASAEIFGRNPLVITGGAVYPFGKAVVTQGGFTVSGRWSYASGCQHCAWLAAFCQVFDGDMPRTRDDGPDIRVVVVPAKSVTIHDTWDVSGLAGTGSHDFTIEPLFVPAAYTYALRPDEPLGRAYQGPLYRFPFWGLFTVPIGAVALGIAQGALDACLESAATRGRSGRAELLRDRPTFQAKVGETASLIRAARAWLHASAQQAWEATVAGRSASLQERADLILAGTHATHTAAAAVRMAYTEAGGSANYRRSPLQRALRDIHAATQHVGIAPHWFEEAGRLLLGFAPSRPIVLL
jgi:alkylation response protein AidB-like acyl-CoA dehydrogenase